MDKPKDGQLLGGFGFCLLLRALTPSSQDYHWQWRSFLTSGFTAVYFLVYAIHYFFSKLQITGLASTILYFGYTMIMALIFFLFTGRYLKKEVSLHCLYVSFIKLFLEVGNQFEYLMLESTTLLFRKGHYFKELLSLNLF